MILLGWMSVKNNDSFKSGTYRRKRRRERWNGGSFGRAMSKVFMDQYVGFSSMIPLLDSFSGEAKKMTKHQKRRAKRYPGESTETAKSGEVRPVDYREGASIQRNGWKDGGEDSPHKAI